MGRGTEQTFSRRRYPDGQQVHENVLNNTNYQENANPNHNEILSNTCQNGYHEKRQEITSVSEDVEKGEPLFIVDRNVNWCSYYGKQYGGSSKN